MSSFGNFTDKDAFRLIRLIRTKPAQVWCYLTEPEKMASWLADAEIDLRLGGRVQLLMLPKRDQQKPEERTLIRGTITRCDAEQILAFIWRAAMPGAAELETEVAFELSGQGEKTQLIVTHRRLTADWLVPVACGWHLLIEDLAARVLGQQPAPFMARVADVMPEYQRRADELHLPRAGAV